MDADLSHPPEQIPRMLEALASGGDLVVGSRYVRGGSTDATWSGWRWLTGKIATLLARPFTSIRDPMSGSFATHRSWLDVAAPLRPIGYKICLELIVKCPFARIVEIPIHFADRHRGQSKLSFRENVRYLRHLCRLFAFKYGCRPYQR